MKKILKRFFKGIATFSLVASIFVFLIGAVVANSMPDNYKSCNSENINFGNTIPLSIKSANADSVTVFSENDNNLKKSQLMLFNKIPIKSVNLDVENEKTVNVSGAPFGIKIYTDGVLVVGISDVMTSSGSICPAKECGLNVGDVILTMNNQSVKTNEEVSNIISESKGEAINLQVSRNNETFTTDIVPVVSSDGSEPKAGLWVRDSSAGIGMLTYYDKENSSFGGLGHGICDTDTEQLMPLSTGDIVDASISSVVKGEKGYPGQLHGSFTNKDSIGTIYSNGEEGVYGTMSEPPENSSEYAVANKQEVKKGDAQIITTIDGTTPEIFDIKITNINYSEQNLTQNLTIEITDDDLLSRTGGIVQGMSGSPIIQNGKFVGAVTHVFVNDPTKGYAIFADNMVSESNKIG